MKTFILNNLFIIIIFLFLFSQSVPLWYHKKDRRKRSKVGNVVVNEIDHGTECIISKALSLFIGNFSITDISHEINCFFEARMSIFLFRGRATLLVS